MPIYTRSVSDSTVTNFLFGGMPFAYLGEFTLRDGNQYLDVRTNIGNNQMLSVFFWGYLYGRGNCFGYFGGYPYTDTLVLNSNISNMVGSPANTAGQTILTNVYRATAANSYGTCLKFDSRTTGYTEGKINIFANNHGGAASGWAVTSFAQNNIAGTYY